MHLRKFYSTRLLKIRSRKASFQTPKVTKLFNNLLLLFDILFGTILYYVCILNKIVASVTFFYRPIPHHWFQLVPTYTVESITNVLPTLYII